MTNFEKLKSKIYECKNVDDFIELMTTNRYDIFPCEHDMCDMGKDCNECYVDWLRLEWIESEDE